MGSLVRESLASVRRTFAAHVPLYACAAAFCAASWAATAYWRVPLSLDASLFFLEMVPVFLLLGLSVSAGIFFIGLARRRAERPLHELGAWLARGFLKGERPGNSFHGLLAFTPLMVSFAALKNDIPLIVPFSWDETFARWDRVIGFGRAPWEWLQPWLGHPPVTAAINLVYDGWFAVMFGALIWQAFSARTGTLRMQFLLAFAFAWFFAGNVLAVVFSSAGPCYYGLLHLPPDSHGGPYAAQMDYLRAAAAQWPVWSVGVQDALWRSYTGGHATVSGISAMPSMHVVIAVVVTMLGWRTNRWLGAALALFTGVIVVGAVHLAWHYAVDTIAGAALGFFFWYAAGAVARRYQAWLAATRRPAWAPAS
ncbi:MAG TPA: phosphatase PAP2 family protein [Rhizomicrobium sp.]|nr:phosphatase PAP2 family protein [Rhizomicrobium sp.]